MRPSTIRWSILILILLAGVGHAANRKAPDFTLTDLGDVKQSLGDLKGKVVGLYFWATYCPGCVKSFPVVERLSGDYRRKGAVILGMNSQLAASKFMARNGFKLRTLHDPYGKVTKSYGISAIPVLVLIDKRGMIARTFVGGVPEKEVRAAIDSLLRGSSPAPAKPSTSPGTCEIVKLDASPVRSSGRILVPMRGIFQWLGAKVKWNENARSVTAARGSRKLEITVGSRRAKIGGKSVSLNAPPQMIKGTVYVPLRFVGQALGVKVEYRPQDGGILLKSGSKCGFVVVD